MNEGYEYTPAEKTRMWMTECGATEAEIAEALAENDDDECEAA